MLFRGIFAVFCAAGFGVLFIVAGIKRILGCSRESRRAEAIFWGVFGIVLGAAIIVGVLWFVFGPMPPDDPIPLNGPGE